MYHWPILKLICLYIQYSVISKEKLSHTTNDIEFVKIKKVSELWQPSTIQILECV
jgi:hypothetical protein